MRTERVSLSRRGAARVAAGVCLLALAAGCKTPLRSQETPLRFETQEEAGSGHVAVLSVSSWNEYVRDELQPRFDLSATRALGEVAPTTAVMETKLLDMLRAVTKASYREKGVSAEEEAKVPEEKPRDLPDPAAKLEAMPERKTMAEPLGMDPMLRYSLAAALYQEVRLLSRYVTDAAVPRGYTPYVVRLQVSLLPRARNEPYDAYSTLAFFPEPRDGAVIPTLQPPPAAAEPGASVPTLRAMGASGASPSRGGPPCVPAPCGVPAGVVAVPLLVTDDLEALLASRSAEVVRQYALALSAVIRSFSGTVDVERYVDELVATAGRDPNSLYTVSRLNDNTMRVRMGAMLQSTGRPAMVPQTRSVTVLLLVPGTTPPEALSVFARTEFADVATGKVLPPRTPERLDRLTAQTFSDAEVLRCIRDPEAQRALMRLVSGNRYEEFVGAYGAAAPGRTESEAQQAWVTLVSVHVGSQFSAASIPLPRDEAYAAELIASLGVENPKGATGFDDGQGKLSVELQARFPAGRSLSAALFARLVVAPESKDPVTVPASRVLFVEGRRVLRLEFPSLGAMKVGGGVTVLSLAQQGDPVVVHVSDGRISTSAGLPVRVVSVLPRAETLEDRVKRAAPHLQCLPSAAIPASGSTKVPARLRFAQAPGGDALKAVLKASFGGTAAPKAVLSSLEGKAGGPLKAAFNEVEVPIASGEGEHVWTLEFADLVVGAVVTLTLEFPGTSVQRTAQFTVVP